MYLCVEGCVSTVCWFCGSSFDVPWPPRLQMRAFYVTFALCFGIDVFCQSAVMHYCIETPFASRHGYRNWLLAGPSLVLYDSRKIIVGALTLEAFFPSFFCHSFLFLTQVKCNTTNDIVNYLSDQKELTIALVECLPSNRHGPNIL